MARAFNVYGIGNALVDIQYRVTPDFLARFGIEKGVMTLIEEDRHHELLDRLGDDVLKRSSGGSAANTMIAVAGLGGTAYYACKVAKDAYGDFYLRDLAEARVASNRFQGEGITGKCLVMITDDADRTMNTYLGITGTFGPEQLESDVIRRSDYLYIEGYLMASDVGFASAMAAQAEAHAGGTRVSLSLSDPSIVAAFGDRMRTLVTRGVDLLFCNEDEARAFSETGETDEACVALETMVGAYAVTCEANGAIVWDGVERFRSPGFSVDAVDTNGAGDMFAGAYLFGITGGLDAEQSAKLANYASMRVVAQYGPRLEESLTDEVERILAM
ncbi:MAG: adenosine kinase [Gemmatimonadota bacterium]|nr:adenosine kinase [Gemmatimonadota bacterium]